MKVLLLQVIILLTTTMVEVLGQNRLQRFLMMVGKKKSPEPKRHPANKDGEPLTTADLNADLEDSACLDPKALATLQGQLQAAEKSRIDAEAERSKLANQVENFKKQLARLEEEKRTKEDDLARALHAEADFREKVVREQDGMVAEIAKLRASLDDVKVLTQQKGNGEIPQEIEGTGGSDQCKRLKDELQAQKAKVFALEQEKSQIRATLEAELKREQSLVREYEKEKSFRSQKMSEMEHSFSSGLESAKKSLMDLQAKHEELQSACDDALNSKGDVEQQILARVAAEIRKVELEVEQKWQSQYANLRAEAENSLDEAKAAAQKALTVEQELWKMKLQELRESQKEEMKAMASAHSVEIDHLKEELREMSVANSRLTVTNREILASVQSLQDKLDLSLQDVHYWESAFHERSLFNFTHFASCTSASAGGVRKVIYVVLEPSMSYWRGVYDSTFKDYYEESVKPYVRRVYEEHLMSLADDFTHRISTVVTPIVRGVKVECEKAVASSYGLMVDIVQQGCTSFVDVLVRRRSSPELIDSVSTACHNEPEAFVRSALEILGALAVIMFGRSVMILLLKVLLWVVMFVPRTVASILFGPAANESKPMTTSQVPGKNNGRNGASIGRKS